MSTKQHGSQLLNGLRSYRVTDGQTVTAVRNYLEALDCPRSLAVWILFREGEHQQLVDLGISVSDYSDTESFRDAYFATEYLSKSTFLKVDVDKRKAAMSKFFEFEERCKTVNSRFRALEKGGKTTPILHELHHAIRGKISRILGDFDFKEFFDLANWGPGASTLIKRRDASSPAKFQREVGITRDLLPLLLDRLPNEYPLWWAHLATGKPVFEIGNKVTTVPKNAKIDRVIAIEPGINLWFQKAVGEMIGLRLRRCGIDLRHQSRNQQLAFEASRRNHLMTVDLSSASDSISLELVRDLLPPEWFEVLDACRSHYGSYDGQVFRWNKFSSMGNGFTFQLESLIFYAASYCCVSSQNADRSSVSVYGDDIVIPSSCRTTFSMVMQHYGFLINEKKSHYDSPFRESCGSHYYRGSDCKPIYLKDKLTTILTVYRYANAVRRQAHRVNVLTSCDARFQTHFHSLTQMVPKALRLWIPDGLGDGGFIGSFDEASPQTRAKFQIEGFVVRQVLDRSRKRLSEELGVLLAELWALEQRESFKKLSEVPAKFLNSYDIGKVGRKGFVPLSGRTMISVVKSLVHQWYELGPWL